MDEWMDRQLGEWVDGWVDRHISNTHQDVGEREVNGHESRNADQEGVGVPRSDTHTLSSLLGALG